MNTVGGIRIIDSTTLEIAPRQYIRYSDDELNINGVRVQCDNLLEYLMHTLDAANYSCEFYNFLISAPGRLARFYNRRFSELDKLLVPVTSIPEGCVGLDLCFIDRDAVIATVVLDGSSLYYKLADDDYWFKYTGEITESLIRTLLFIRGVRVRDNTLIYDTGMLHHTCESNSSYIKAISYYTLIDAIHNLIKLNSEKKLVVIKNGTTCRVLPRNGTCICPGDVPKEVTHLVVEEGITEIADRALESHKHLESVLLPSSIQVIGSYSFAKCPSLSEVKLPNVSAQIAPNAFKKCPRLTAI